MANAAAYPVVLCVSARILDVVAAHDVVGPVGGVGLPGEEVDFSEESGSGVSCCHELGWWEEGSGEWEGNYFCS